MKLIHVLTALLVFSTVAQSAPEPMLFSEAKAAENTIVYKWSNEGDFLKQVEISGRSVDYPTQIIRISGDVSDKKISCDFVRDEIEKSISSHISPKKFTYNTYVYCGYDKKTDLATQFIVHSYFDPINDEAIEYLKEYLAKYNGSELLGTKLEIESAKGLLISLHIAAGTKSEGSSSEFLEFRHDRGNHYFKSNYDMRFTLFTDVYKRFFSNNPRKIVPFLNRWIFDYAGMVYYNVLPKSNYVALEPERIFLMEQGEPIFVSNLRYYFGHICTKYKNQHCL